MRDKNKKKLGIAAIWSLAISMLAGCSGSNSFKGGDNDAIEIYGPPEMLEDYIDDPDAGSGNEVNGDEISEDEDFNPEENEPSVIYGPPEMFE